MIAVVAVQVLNRIMHLGGIELGFRNLSKRVSLKMILFVAAVYLIWTMLWVRTIYESVWWAIRSFVTLRFIAELMNAASFTTSGFLFKDIYATQLAVYAVLLVFPTICILINLRRWKFGRNGKPVNHIEALFAIVSLAYVVFSYALYLAGRDHHLLADGLIYFSIMSSVSMGFVLLSQTRSPVSPRLRSLCFLGLLVFLYVSFPIVSFSKEAYNTYVPSQNAGLTFVAGYVDAYNNSLAMSSDQQFVPYLNMSKSIGLLSLRATNFPPNLNKTHPDYVVIHANSFFVRALRYDLSLQENRITLARDYLERSVLYDKVYSNRDFNLYYLNNETAYVGEHRR